MVDKTTTSMPSDLASSSRQGSTTVQSPSRSSQRTRVFERASCRVGPMDPDVAIRVSGVSKSFGEQKVLDGIQLDVRRGELLAILGGSGSGKSTLLRHMTGALTPDSGQVIVNLPQLFGEAIDLARMTSQQRDEYRMSIGVLFQSGALFNSMSVADNVALPMRMHADLPEETIDIAVKIKLELVGLLSAAERMPAELSGGMKKRAGLARAMALDPQLLFYDEPSAGLDPITTAQIDELMLALNRELNVTSVVVTHEMESAFRIASRMVLLDQGRFIAAGTPEEFKNSTNPHVRQFVAGQTKGPLTDESERSEDYEEALLGPPPRNGNGNGSHPSGGASANPNGPENL